MDESLKIKTDINLRCYNAPADRERSPNVLVYTCHKKVYYYTQSAQHPPYSTCNTNGLQRGGGIFFFVAHTMVPPLCKLTKSKRAFHTDDALLRLFTSFHQTLLFCPISKTIFCAHKRKTKISVNFEIIFFLRQTLSPKINT